MKVPSLRKKVRLPSPPKIPERFSRRVRLPRPTPPTGFSGGIGYQRFIENLQAEQQQLDNQAAHQHAHALEGAIKRREALIAELAPLHARLAELRANIREAQAPVDRLAQAHEQARDRIAAAQSAIAEFDRARLAGIRSSALSVENGDSQMPATERRALENELADAQRDLGHITVVKQEADERLESANTAMIPVHREIDQLIVKILYEQAELAGAEYLIAIDKVAGAYARLVGLNTVLRSFDHVGQTGMLAGLPGGDPATPGICSADAKEFARSLDFPDFRLYCLHEYPPTMLVKHDEYVQEASVWRAFADRLRNPTDPTSNS